MSSSRGHEHLVGYGPGGSERALPVPPKQARGVEKHDRLYRAALERFEVEGVKGTRIEDIVDDVGVSWATFFRYFPRKEDVLIEGAARHFRDHVLTTTRSSLNDRRLRIRTVLGRAFASLVTPVELSPSLHAAAMQEVFANPTRFAAMVGDQHTQPMIELVAAVLEAGQDRGEIRADVPAAVQALTVSAGALFPAVQAASVGAEPGPVVAEALSMLWVGLEANGRPRSRARGR